MTREDVKTLFPDATEEQVTKMLNQHNAEVTKANKKAEQYKADADKVAELTKQIDDINKQGLSEKELLERQVEELNKSIAKRDSDIATLTKANLTAEIATIFAQNGLVGDYYTGVIEAFSNLSKEDAIEKAKSFAVGVTEANKTAMDNLRSEIETKQLEDTPNPGGATDGNTDNKESNAAKYAQKYSQKMNPSEQQASDNNAPVNF